MHAKE